MKTLWTSDGGWVHANSAKELVTFLAVKLAYVERCPAGDYNEGRRDAFLSALYAVAGEFDIDEFKAIEDAKAMTDAELVEAGAL